MSKQSQRRLSARKAADPASLEFRTFATRAETIDDAQRTVEAVITTEAPTMMFDWERYEFIPEVLLMAGVEHPRQVPLLNSHNRNRIDDQLGSIRNIRAEGPDLVGRLHFSSVATDAWTKAKEGHVTDVSAGYRVLERTHVPKGESQVINGKKYEGPINVVTKWRLHEGSITPIGADDQAKLRGFQNHPFQKDGFRMNPELRALCLKLGMDEKLSDEEAQRWMVANLGAKAQPKGEGEKGKPVDPPDYAALIETAVRKLADEREAKQIAFRRDVDSLCELTDLPNLRSECYSLPSIDKVRERLQQAKADRQVEIGAYIQPGPSQIDKGRQEIGTALLLRCLEVATNGDQKRMETIFPAAERAKDANKYRNASLMDMARECLLIDGARYGDISGLSREHLAIAAMGWPEKVGLRYGPGYHTTGSFPKITANSFNKSLMAGYTETPETWRGPMRQGPSVPDFKTINRVRMGAIPNLPVWPDNKKPEEASFADTQEPYAVEAYSEKVSFSWRLLINDDMDALSRTPQQLGAAAKRTVNATAWAQITSNPLLGDGIAAFSAASGVRKRSNLTTGAGAPATATLQTLSNLMMQMRGENTPEGNEGPDVLGLRPKYLVGPSALNTTIMQLILSTYDPASANMLYNTAAQLIPVIEPLLDTASTTAWYLFADPSQIDTVEVTFLQGQENPVQRNWLDEEYLSQHFAVLQSFGAKIMNHRGIQKHAGA